MQLSAVPRQNTEPKSAAEKLLLNFASYICVAEDYYLQQQESWPDTAG